MLNVQPDGRKCTICGAKLSIYNPGDECFCHSLPKDQNNHGRIPMCTSYNNIGRYYATRDYYGAYVDEY